VVDIVARQGQDCKGKPYNTPIYWLQSPISAVLLILMYFLAIWRSEALHYYKDAVAIRSLQRREAGDVERLQQVR